MIIKEASDVKGRRLMRQKLTLLVLPVGMLIAACTSIGCTSTGPGGVSGHDGTNGNGDGSKGGPGSSTDPGSEPEGTVLDQRVVDYNEAIRTASIKLVRALPSLATITKIQKATDKKAAYTEELDKLFADPRFDARMVKFWRDAMRIGGGGNMDTAPVLAAKIMKEGRPYTDLFTATNGTCPSFDGDTMSFVDGDCDNGVSTHAGVLTNPGVMSQFYSNMAFRRVRWVQETFVCTKFPAEVVDAPTQIDGKDYTSPWAFESISNTPINFKDTSSVVCANCHTTSNHMAPLFANFDDQGQYQQSIQVFTPQVPDPVQTEMTHWLPAGQKTAWRNGQDAADLPALGAAMAADTDVQECAVTRMWNFAMSKEDVVNDLATVPYEVIEPYVASFDQSGFDLKTTLRDMMLSEDFVSF